MHLLQLTASGLGLKAFDLAIPVLLFRFLHAGFRVSMLSTLGVWV